MADLVEWTPARWLVVLLGAAVGAVIVGVVIGRTTAPTRAGGSPTTAASATASATPVPAGASIPGAPTRVNSLGIPVGYPHTEAGAISACGNYVSAYENRDNRDSSRLRQVFASMTISASVERLSKEILASDSKTVKYFGAASINSPQLAFDLRPVGYQVKSTRHDRVVVSVWSTGGVGQFDSADNTAAQQSWGTDVCTVAWQSSDWKLTDASDGPNGPAITERAATAFSRFAYIGGVTS